MHKFNESKALRKKVISKGYTITVVSWENDGDNYNTNTMVVDSIEIAETIYRMCTELFISRGKGGIGNMGDRDERRANGLIIDFMKKHSILYNDDLVITDDDMVDICMDYNCELMGGSEYYYSRVMERCTIVYSPEDIYLEEITF